MTKDKATQIERAYGGCVNDLTCEGVRYELERIGMRQDGLKLQIMERLCAQRTMREGPRRAFPLD